MMQTLQWFQNSRFRHIAEQWASTISHCTVHTLLLQETVQYCTAPGECEEGVPSYMCVRADADYATFYAPCKTPMHCVDVKFSERKGVSSAVNIPLSGGEDSTQKGYRWGGWNFQLSTLKQTSIELILPSFLYSYHLATADAFIAGACKTDIRENFDTNECPNIFVSTKLHEWLSEYIHTNFFDTNECPNKYSYWKLHEYSNIRLGFTL